MASIGHVSPLHGAMEPKEIEPSPPPPSPSRWWCDSKDETVAVVTGANKGIGFALVKKLADFGVNHVILTARDNQRGLKSLDSLKESAQLLHTNARIYFCRLDVSDPDSIDSFVSWLKLNFGALDVLVNNAAVSFNGIHENSVEHAETVIHTNFYGPKLLTEALLPLFRFSASRSRILNMSSRLGLLNKLKNPKIKEKLLDDENLSEERIESVVTLFLDNVKQGTWQSQGWPITWTDYAVSKIALNAYSKVLARRYKERGLSVNCYCPGFTKTSMTGYVGTHNADDAAEIGAKLALLPPEELPTGKFFMARSTLVCSNL